MCALLFFYNPGYQLLIVLTPYIKKFTMSRPISRQFIDKARAILVKRQVTTNAVTEIAKNKSKRLVFDSRSPSLQDFLAQRQLPTKPIDSALAKPDQIPYLQAQGQQLGRGRKFYIEVYGCQVRCPPPLFFLTALN